MDRACRVAQRGAGLEGTTHPLLSFRLEVPRTPRLAQIQHPWLLLPVPRQRSQQVMSVLLVTLLEAVQAWRMTICILGRLRGLLLRGLRRPAERRKIVCCEVPLPALRTRRPVPDNPCPRACLARIARDVRC